VKNIRFRLPVAGVCSALLLLTAPLAGQHQGATARKTQPITVQWLGHAAFEVTSSTGTKILIDPFLSGDPATPDSLKKLSRYHPNVILVLHSHSDHSLDAAAIALSSGAPVISVYEYVSSLKLPEQQSMGGNVGGTFKIGDVLVHLVPAMHSSDPGGRPLGSYLNSSTGGRCITRAIPGFSAICHSFRYFITRTSFCSAQAAARLHRARRTPCGW
jgi:hypothetical protein